MALTRKQQKLLADIHEACSIARIDLSHLDEHQEQWRTTVLQLILRKVITGYVLETYTLIDEQMSDAICRIYFEKPGKRIHFGRLWKTKKFKSFVHNALDNNRLACLFSLTLFATGVAICVLMIAAYSRPFTGEISVGPDLLQQVITSEAPGEATRP